MNKRRPSIVAADVRRRTARTHENPPANVPLRQGTAGVSPASSRGVSPRVGTGGETPPKLAGADACATSARPLSEHRPSTLAPCCAVSAFGFSPRRRLPRSVERVLANLSLHPNSRNGFGQRNGDKGMKTKRFPVPIPLPPFLCPKFRCPTPVRPSAPRRSLPTSPLRLPSTLAPCFAVSVLGFAARRRLPALPLPIIFCLS